MELNLVTLVAAADWMDNLTTCNFLKKKFYAELALIWFKPTVCRQ